MVASEFAFDVDEHMRAARAVLRYTPFRWFTRIGVALLSLVLAGAIGVVLGMVRVSPILVSATPWIVIFALWTLMFPMVSRWSIRRALRQDPSVRGVQRRSIDESGFRTEGNGVAVDLPWHAMARVVESDEFLLFFYNKQCAYYLGKPRLSAAEVDEAHRLMAGRRPMSASTSSASSAA